MGAVYCLVVPGRPRTYAKIAVAVLVPLFCLARLYLAVDHPDDVVFGVALGVAIPVAAFRWFTPNEVFPVVYRRGRAAHLDVTGRRGEAIRTGDARPARAERARDQAVRAGSSGGSTPLRLRVDGGPRRVPVREAVRQEPRPRRPLVQALADDPLRHPRGRDSRSRRCGGSSSTRTTRCGCCGTTGSPPPRPYGIVEITPEREYMLVTEFFTGAVEIRRGRRRRRRDRPGAAADPEAVGRRARPPGHQAGRT